MKRPLYICLAVAVGIILFMSILAFKRYMPYMGRGMMPAKPPAIMLTLDDTYFVGMGKQGKLWSLKADKVEIGRNRSITTLTNIKDGHIYDGKQVALKVKAGKAVYDMHKENLNLSGGITVEGNNGERVVAKDAEWESDTSTLNSRGQVHFQNDWSKITGNKLVVNLKREELIIRNVSLRINLNDVN